MTNKDFNGNFEVFSKENLGSVRTMMGDNGSIWFVGKDVCDILGIKNTGNAYTRLLDTEKAIIRSTDDGGNNASGIHPVQFTVISESGLYMLIMGSRKAQAVTFQRWVTQEVLPSIRKNGGYILGQETLPDAEKHQMELQIKALSDQVTALKRKLKLRTG